ncbi:LAQU0S02e00364g1_1 [Lachancea quebecensis]|uniref:LAQU0S02e00364g1_1 n=1 Tax=Lachancea quebecensis TaxID=1654605 RepID=A0A0P1KQB7_9SACH|nr:LAQU0S02e00364g1_1 [Lachancea quebecensis]
MDCTVKLEQRVSLIENITGELDGVENLLDKLRVISGEMRRLCGIGARCSGFLWQLLNTFAKNDERLSNKDQEVKLSACVDLLDQTLSQMSDLELVYSSNVDRLLSCGLLDTPLKQEPVSADLSNISALYSQTMTLIVRTLSVARRFMDLNLEANNFWTHVQSRIYVMEGRMNSIQHSRTI